MSAIGLLVRAQLRRRGASLFGLALLVALVAATTLTALAGARRTASTVDRFRSWADASDVWYQTESAEDLPALLDTLRADPAVDAATPRYFVTAFPEQAPFLELVSDPEGALGTSVDRERVLRGRLPGPDSADEVLINELAAELLGVDVGGTVSVRTWSYDDIAALNGPEFPGFNGPHLDLTVVGVGRTPADLNQDVRAGSPVGLVSSSFLAAHPDLGAWPPAAVVRLRDPTQIDRVNALAIGVTEAGRPVAPDTAGGDGSAPAGDNGYFPAQESAANAYQDDAQRAVDGLAVALLVFGVVVAVAGGVVVAQAVSREVATRAETARTLGAMGLTRARRAFVLAVPALVAAIGGAAAGAAASIAGSALLPLGVARRSEIAPGVRLDGLVLVGGSVLVVAAVAAWAYVAARRVGATSAPQPRARSSLVRLALALGLPVAATTGVRYATDRTRGRASLRTRSAMAAVAVAVAGVVGAGVMVRSLDDLVSEPAHWGWNWSTVPDAFGEVELAQVAQDPRISGVATLESGTVVIDGVPLGGAAMEVAKGDMTLTRVSGRLPTGPGEVALGQATMRGLRVSEGDVVRATAPDGSAVELTVVGEAVLPPLDITAIDEGAVLTPDALGALEQGDPGDPSVALRYAPGVDTSALEADLADRFGLEFGPYAQPAVPSGIRDVFDTRDVALGIGAFFVVLGLLGLAHALIVSGRRRRVDVAVLRAVGLRGRQVGVVFLVESLVVTGVGLLIGVPGGLILGRAIWHALVDHLGVVAVPQQPWALLALVVPAALVPAAALSWWPGHSLRRRRPALSLRSE